MRNQYGFGKVCLKCGDKYEMRILPSGQLYCWTCGGTKKEVDHEYESASEERREENKSAMGFSVQEQELR